MRREGIDQPAGFQRLDAVDEVGRHDEGVALIERFGPAADGYLEAAFGDIARLHMRVRMQRADRAFSKGELDHHQRIGMREHAPAVAVRRRCPADRPGMREEPVVAHRLVPYRASQPPSTGTTAPCM